jgi:hypothetical protein
VAFRLIAERKISDLAQNGYLLMAVFVLQNKILERFNKVLLR